MREVFLIMKLVCCLLLCLVPSLGFAFDGATPDCYQRLLHISDLRGVRLETDIIELNPENVVDLVREATGPACQYTVKQGTVECVFVPEENPLTEICMLDVINGYFLVNLSYEDYANVEFYRWDFW